MSFGCELILQPFMTKQITGKPGIKPEQALHCCIRRYKRNRKIKAKSALMKFFSWKSYSVSFLLSIWLESKL